MGRRKERVFPEPVCACMTVSRSADCKRWGREARWMGVGLVTFNFAAKCAQRTGSKPQPSNVVAVKVGRGAGAGTAGVVWVGGGAEVSGSSGLEVNRDDTTCDFAPPADFDFLTDGSGVFPKAAAEDRFLEAASPAGADFSEDTVGAAAATSLAFVLIIFFAACLFALQLPFTFKLFAIVDTFVVAAGAAGAAAKFNTKPSSSIFWV